MKKETILLLIIMLLSLSTMLYYGSKKEGYHVDELYSMGWPTANISRLCTLGKAATT